MKGFTQTKATADHIIRRSTFFTVLVDILLMLAFVGSLLLYISRNNTKSYSQNIENITNIATANAELLQAALDNSSADVKRAYNYCRGKSPSEVLDYLALINNPDEEYQLLRLDETVSTELYHVYSGYSTRKDENGYQFVEYKGSSLPYSLFNHASQEEGTISYSQSFTNQTDALRYFSAFCSITTKENGETQLWYLVKPQKESIVLDQIHNYTAYADLSTAICYTDGKYLAHGDGFRADNFFDYLYKYNDLSVDDVEEIKTSIRDDEDGVGVLAYKNFKKNDCTFAYATCGDSDAWLVVVSVPVAEFAVEKLLSPFPNIIIVFLSVLLMFNIYRLLGMVRQLRSSAEREQVANVAKSSFLSRMSHEIRTPLNAIIGYNTIAKNEMTAAKTDAEHRQAETKVLDCLTKNEIASRHLLAVINDVLDMSAIESQKLKLANDRFDFKGLILSLTTVFYSQAKAKGVDFQVVFDTPTEEWFVGDQMRVNQVLTNLLSNAIKFTPCDGSVVLRVSQPKPEEEIPHIHFEVTDTGIGMAADYLSHIWTPFEQADSSISRRFGGSGLGLSITKTLVDLMGGDITVESKLGAGTTFFLDLVFGKTEQPPKTGGYDFSRVNALVVDDDTSTCEYVSRLFYRCGAKCTTFTSGADAVEAVSIAEKEGRPFTICLVDWKMPKMNGVETICRIRENVQDDIPIVILTAYDYTELADKAAEIGISQFISKPLFQSTLFDLLANICGTPKDCLPAKSEKHDFSGYRVILAEDNAMNMEIAATIMKSVGLTVDSAWNGREAVELFTASAPGTYQLILMDVHMPDMNGYEATQAIRGSSHPEAGTIPIVAMTADAFAENVAESYAAGMNGHITKPIDISTLFDTIQQFL